jgi:hypothetical protein
VSNALREDNFINIEFFRHILVLVRLFQSWQKVTLHECLIFARYFLRGDTVDAIGVVSDSDEEGGEKNGHIEAVSLLPPGHIGWTRYAFGEFVRRIQFLILYKLAKSLGALFVVIKLQKSKLGRPDSGAYKFVHFALIFGEEEEFSIFSNVLLELFFELDDMFED